MPSFPLPVFWFGYFDGFKTGSRVLTSNLALLINSSSMASSYSEMEEQVGMALLITVERPAAFAME